MTTLQNQMPATDPAPRVADASERFRLTESAYRTFRQTGYLVVRGLVSSADVAELQAHTDDMMQGRLPEQADLDAFDPDAAEAQASEDDRTRGEAKTSRHLFKPSEDLSPQEKAQQFLRIHMLHRKLALHERFLLHPRVLDVVEALIGPDVMAMQSMLFLKPPGSAGQGWHQDSFYIPTTPDSLLGAWIAIDDADEYNGGLWFAKGSHIEPVHPPCPESTYGFGDHHVADIYHARGESNPDDTQNTLSNVAERYDAVLAPAKAGDVVFFGGHVLHRSKANVTTDRFRRAFVGHYANARSFTAWGHDPEHPAPKTALDEQTGSTNGCQILARGDTHLAYAKPRFGTPCAATLAKGQRGEAMRDTVRRLRDADGGLLGCGIVNPGPTQADAAS